MAGRILNAAQRRKRRRARTSSMLTLLNEEPTALLAEMHELAEAASTTPLSIRLDNTAGVTDDVLRAIGKLTHVYRLVVVLRSAAEMLYTPAVLLEVMNSLPNLVCVRADVCSPHQHRVVLEAIAPRITDLQISFNRSDVNVLEALLQAPGMPRLTEVAYMCYWGDNNCDAPALFNTLPPSVQRITLHSNGLSPATRQALVDFVRCDPDVKRELSVWTNDRFSDAHIKALLQHCNYLAIAEITKRDIQFNLQALLNDRPSLDVEINFVKPEQGTAWIDDVYDHLAKTTEAVAEWLPVEALPELVALMASPFMDPQ
jgi:hypothetical protein